MRTKFLLAISMLAVLLLAACGGTVDGAPKIDSFNAEPATITPGGSSTLSWSISGVEEGDPPVTISIDNGVGEVTGESFVVSPTETTEYTLTVSNTLGEDTATATVTVEGDPVPTAPSISFFSATPDTIDAGGSSTLSWDVTNADSVSIDSDVGEVNASGSLDVFPVATTTYTLTATNTVDSVTAQATVTVGGGTGNGDVSNTFDEAGDLEGWSLDINENDDLTNPGVDGNPGGYLKALPGGPGVDVYYIAPAQFLGDLSTYTALNFDLYAESLRDPPSPYAASGGDVIIENGALIAKLDLPTVPTSDWTSYSFSLTDDTSWTLEGGATSLAEVLSNVTSLKIRAELIDSGPDESGLDNVSLVGGGGGEED